MGTKPGIKRKPGMVIAFLTIALCALVWPAVISATASDGQTSSLQFETPKAVLKGIPFSVTVTSTAELTGLELVLDERRYRPRFEDGKAIFERLITNKREAALQVTQDGKTIGRKTVSTLPAWISVLPAIAAIGMALLFRQVIPALIIGIWLGATLVAGFSLSGLWRGALDVVPVYTLGALNDEGHLSIIVFTLLIGGLVGIISRNGGMTGIVNYISRFATSTRRGQLATSGLGMAIFFDDYANTMVVGNAMRPVTDSLRISREKLAYLVDSTAAPVASIALVTTWIGFQVGLIGDSVSKIDAITETPYSIFLNSIPFAFYGILALVFVFFVAWTGRDFGPMLKAERRALTTGDLGGVDEEHSEQHHKAIAEGRIPARAINAILPLGILIFGTLAGIYVTGLESAGDGASMRDVIGSGDSYKAMMWASWSAVLVAAVMTLAQRLLDLPALIDAWYAGVKSMVTALVILTLAWALSQVNDDLQTAEYLASALGGTLSPAFVPALVFVLAGAMAFATGTSWGVMGIMVPLVVPVAWTVMSSHAADPSALMPILYASVVALLSGAVWGDHCSPISDTTILSSMAAKCDHIEHVRTQLPYALGVGLVSIFIGYIPAGLGVPWWLLLPLGAGILFFLLRSIGERA